MESESDEPTSGMHAILEVMGLELAVYGIESASNHPFIISSNYRIEGGKRNCGTNR